jgi:hypothetical protein
VFCVRELYCILKLRHSAVMNSWTKGMAKGTEAEDSQILVCTY